MALVRKGIGPFAESPGTVRGREFKAGIGDHIKIEVKGDCSFDTGGQQVKPVHCTRCRRCFLGHKRRAPIGTLRRVGRLNHREVGDFGPLADADHRNLKTSRNGACDVNRAEPKERFQPLGQLLPPGRSTVGGRNTDRGCRTFIAKRIIANAGFAACIGHLGHGQGKLAAFFDATTGGLDHGRCGTVFQRSQNLGRFNRRNR